MVTYSIVFTKLLPLATLPIEKTALVEVELPSPYWDVTLAKSPKYCVVPCHAIVIASILEECPTLCLGVDE